MTFKEKVINYLLRFDFSKKVAFVLGTTIFATCFLFVNIAISEHGLATVLKNQQTGIGYHNRVMSIYTIAITYLSQLNSATEFEKNSLKSRLETTPPLFHAIINDLNTSLQHNVSNEINFYTNRTQQLNENYQNILRLINEIKGDGPAEQALLRNHLISLKNELIYLMDIISNIFGLDVSLNAYDGIEFDIIFKRILSLQDDLSNIISLDNKNMNPQLYTELEVNKFFIANDLLTINADRQYSYENQQTHVMENPLGSQIFEDFLTDMTNFSKLLNNLNVSSIAEAPWADLQKTGLEATFKAVEFYNSLSITVKDRLSYEAAYFHRKQLLSCIFLLFGILLVLSPYLTKAFLNPLSDLKAAAEKLAKGDLSVRIPVITSDEVGEVSRSFNETANFFEKIMLETDKFATLLSDSSSEIFNTAKQLEHNLSLQEESIQAITQNSKNITKNVLEFTAPLEQVNEAILVTADNVSLSKDSLDTMESIMQQMVSSANNTVLELSSIKSEINKITSVINTLVVIADQINLLSLNTAVRANNAGQKKFGFAVIADKISELADQTAFATLDMEQIVKHILSFVPEIIQDIDHFGTEIQEALQDSLAVREHFQKLLSMTQVQISSFKNIQSEMLEQTNKANEIDKSFESLIQSTQKTTRSVRSLYVEIEYLYHGTLNLHRMTKRFTGEREG
jgi:methyl-accepting chemotaxis protein